jgi:hypothetical protein
VLLLDRSHTGEGAACKGDDGQTDANRVQRDPAARAPNQRLGHLPVKWHFIGLTPQ